MPDPQKILATIRKATELMRSTPGRSGSVIALDEADEVMVVGDLHGNLPAFRQALAIAALDQHPRRHLVLQELVHEINKNDDDRPDRSHRLVDLVSALKCQYPERVHLILGNHELSELTGRIIGKDGQALNLRFRQGMELAYGARTQEVYQAYLDLFAALPLAVRTPNRVFVCHTLPDARYLDDLDLALFKADHWPDRGHEAGRYDLRPDLGPRHHPRDGRPLRRNGRRRLVHHRPSALRRGVPPGQPSPDHHRWNESLPGLLPLSRAREPVTIESL